MRKARALWRRRTCTYSYLLVSCALTVVQEGAEAAAVEVIQDRQQEVLVKLEGCGKLRGKRHNSKNVTFELCDSEFDEHAANFQQL